MSAIINCLSGLSGHICGMKVREERVLADRKLAKNGGQVDELLGACWEETLDAGPYDFGDTTAFDRREKTGRERSESEGRHSEGGRKVIDWGQVLQGDRFYALLQIRRADRCAGDPDPDPRARFGGRLPGTARRGLGRRGGGRNPQRRRDDRRPGRRRHRPAAAHHPAHQTFRPATSKRAWPRPLPPARSSTRDSTMC